MQRERGHCGKARLTVCHRSEAPACVCSSFRVIKVTGGKTHSRRDDKGRQRDSTGWYRSSGAVLTEVPGSGFEGLAHSEVHNKVY